MNNDGRHKIENMFCNCSAISKGITLKIHLHLNQELMEISMKVMKSGMKFWFKSNENPPTNSLTCRIKINA